MNWLFDPALALLALLLLALVAQVVIQLAYSLSRARKLERLVWILAGSSLMGLGVWAMHLIAMLAWRGPQPLRFDAVWIGLSLLPAILGSAIALLIIVSDRPRMQRVVMGALTLSLALVLMQQLAFFAIASSAQPEFDPVILVLAALLALTACALWLAMISLRIQQAPMAPGWHQRVSAALLVALGLTGMCFSGMLALEPAAGVEYRSGAGTTNGELLALLGGSNVFLYAVGLLLIGWIDRRRLLSTMALSQRKLRSARRFSEAIDEQARELTQALQKSQQRLALAMEGSQDGLWDVDVPANEVLISRRMAMMLGLGRQDVSLDTGAVLDLLDPVQRVRLLRALQLHWRSGLQRPLDCNLQVLSEGGGRRRSLNLRGSSVLNEQGRPLRVAGSLTDVTLQRQHERELRAWAALIEQHPDALLVLDPAGRIESVNRMALDLLGVPRTELMRRGLPVVVRRLRPLASLRQIRAAWLAGDPWQGALQLRGPLGRREVCLSIGRIHGADVSDPQRLVISARSCAMTPPHAAGAAPR